MERSKYIDRVLQDHLLDQKVYRQLGPGEIDFRIKAARQKLIQILGKAEHEKRLSELTQLTLDEHSKTVIESLSSFVAQKSTRPLGNSGL